MFDHARSRPDLADRLAVILVVLVFLVAAAALPLAALDFKRTGADPQVVAPTAGETLDLATAERCAPCQSLVLRTLNRSAEVPSTGPL